MKSSKNVLREYILSRNYQDKYNECVQRDLLPFGREII